MSSAASSSANSKAAGRSSSDARGTRASAAAAAAAVSIGASVSAAFNNQSSLLTAAATTTTTTQVKKWRAKQQPSQPQHAHIEGAQEEEGQGALVPNISGTAIARSFSDDLGDTTWKKSKRRRPRINHQNGDDEDTVSLNKGCKEETGKKKVERRRQQQQQQQQYHQQQPDGNNCKAELKGDSSFSSINVTTPATASTSNLAFGKDDDDDVISSNSSRSSMSKQTTSSSIFKDDKSVAETSKILRDKEVVVSRSFSLERQVQEEEIVMPEKTFVLPQQLNSASSHIGNTKDFIVGNENNNNSVAKNLQQEPLLTVCHKSNRSENDDCLGAAEARDAVRDSIMVVELSVPQCKIYKELPCGNIADAENSSVTFIGNTSYNNCGISSNLEQNVKEIDHDHLVDNVKAQVLSSSSPTIIELKNATTSHELNDKSNISILKINARRQSSNPKQQNEHMIDDDFASAIPNQTIITATTTTTTNKSNAIKFTTGRLHQEAPLPSGTLKCSDGNRRPTMASGGDIVDSIKIEIYMEASNVHRGKGAARIFSEYIERLGRYLINTSSSSPSLRCRSRCLTKDDDSSIESFFVLFLKTKKLRQMHNKLIMALMKRSMDTRIPHDKLHNHIPHQWSHKVKEACATVADEHTIKSTGDLEIERQRAELCTQILCWKSSFSVESGLWAKCDTSNQLYPPPLCAMDEDISYNTSCSSLVEEDQSSLPSAPVPGALAIDPVIRNIAQREGVTVEEHALWLIIIATRQLTSTILQQAVKTILDDGSAAAARRKISILDVAQVLTKLPMLSGTNASLSHVLMDRLVNASGRKMLPFPPEAPIGIQSAIVRMIQEASAERSKMILGSSKVVQLNVSTKSSTEQSGGKSAKPSSQQQQAVETDKLNNTLTENTDQSVIGGAARPSSSQASFETSKRRVVKPNSGSIFKNTQGAFVGSPTSALRARTSSSKSLNKKGSKTMSEESSAMVSRRGRGKKDIPPSSAGLSSTRFPAADKLKMTTNLRNMASFKTAGEIGEGFPGSNVSKPDHASALESQQQPLLSTTATLALNSGSGVPKEILVDKLESSKLWQEEDNKEGKIQPSGAARGKDLAALRARNAQQKPPPNSLNPTDVSNNNATLATTTTMEGDVVVPTSES